MRKHTCLLRTSIICIDSEGLQKLIVAIEFVRNLVQPFIYTHLADSMNRIFINYEQGRISLWIYY